MVLLIALLLIVTPFVHFGINRDKTEKEKDANPKD